MKALDSPKKRESRAVWSIRYGQWKKSQLSKVSFCKQQGIDPSCFYFWCGVFRKEAPEKSPPLAQKTHTPPFLAVEVTDRHEVLTIECGDMKLHCAGVVSGEQLYQWLKALRRATCSA